MPANLTFPGVYIEEIPSGVRTITGVATSITAFIGRALRGPTDQEQVETDRAVTINSFGDFERIYGGLWEKSTLGFAVRDFFLNGGSQAIIVRLYHPAFDTVADQTAAKDAATGVAAAATGAGAPEAAKAARSRADELAKGANATELLKTAVDVVATAAEAAAAVHDATVDDVKKAATRAADRAVKRIMAPDRAKLVIADLPLVAAYPGSWGGYLRGTIDFNVSADVAANLGLGKSDLFNLTVQEEAPGGRIESFRNLSLKDSARRIDKVLEAESNLVRWDTTDASDPSTKASTLADAQTKLANDQTAVKGAQKALNVLKSSGGDTTQARKDLDIAQQQLIKDQSDAVTAAENKLATAQAARPKVPDDIQQAQTALEDAMDNMLASDGGDLTDKDFTGTGKQGAKQGLFALDIVDLFNILCIPPYKLNTGGYDVDATLVVSPAAQFCEKRRAMLLVDPRSDWHSPADAIGDPNAAQPTGVAGVGTNSKNAALFFPRLRLPNPLKENQLENFVPCGAVAGIFARTDTQRGVWKAPAGLDTSLVGVLQLSVKLTDDENGLLNPLGINCLRAFPAAGRVVWGSRTLQGNDNLSSEWKYIPVRRTALYIEESLFRGTQWVVFEPNDEPLWAQIRLNVGAFMQNLFRQGAFQGQTPKDAYFVKCDKETTTQNDINLGIVNIVVGFAPLKPAEFVVIKLQQIAGQIQV